MEGCTLLLGDRTKASSSVERLCGIYDLRTVGNTC